VTEPVGPTHVDDDLIDLLAGASDPATARRLVAHLRSCPRCVDQLISAVFAVCALRTSALVDHDETHPIHGSGAGSQAAAGGARSEASQVDATGAPRRWRRHLGAVAASVVLLVAGLLIGSRVASGPAPASGPAIVDVQLTPLEAPPSAGGQVTVEATGDTRQLLVRTTALPAPPTNHFYEVWLLDPKTLKMLSMGVLGPSGEGEYAVTAPIMAGYAAVDVSLQANDGDPAHSSISVLRASY
jgi:hypothetical protein